MEQIDEIVKKEVDAEIARMRPKGQQSKLEQTRKELEQTWCELHNS